MVSNVVLTGYLKERVEKDKSFRIIEWKENEVITNRVNVNKVPILFWTREENNPLNRFANDTHVVIKGRIEESEKIGLYVLVEEVLLVR